MLTRKIIISIASADSQAEPSTLCLFDAYYGAAGREYHFVSSSSDIELMELKLRVCRWDDIFVLRTGRMDVLVRRNEGQ